MVAAAEKRRKGQEHRERMARRMREFTASVADIGEIPKVKNKRRKDGCRYDLHRFLATYFPNSTGLSPFSPDHERVIRRIQLCVLEGGRFVNAVYRGFAKTTISENASAWATLYGHRRFVAVFGSGSDTAEAIIESIKLELSENDLLYEDFPEVCHAVRHLEGRPQRRMSQSYRGVLTHIEWSADQIVLPTIPRSAGSGAVICARGITSGFRGLKVKLPDGTQQRPDLCLLDDIQTDESAGTALQVNKTLTTLRKAIAKLGGHRRPLSMVVNATVIQQEDAICGLLNDPSWQGERIPLVKRWPEAHATLWLETYAKLRKTYNKDDPDDQKRAHRQATEFYAANRAAMDAGAEVSWENCFAPDSELSALQHAYNILIDDGEEAFASECQQDPKPREPPLPGELTPDQIACEGRLNNHKRGVVPGWANTLTAFIDVHGELLYYAVCAWLKDGFSGAVVDYGTFPDQRRAYFALRDANPTLEATTGITSLEGRVWAGLDRLCAAILAGEWPTDGGGALKVERCLIDCGWDQGTAVVRRFCRESAYAGVLFPSKGRGVTASTTPISEWKPQPGEKKGRDWVMRAPERGAGRLVTFDSNSWKSFLHSRLSQPRGEAGALTFFGDRPEAHRLLADHLCGEYRVETMGQGRRLFEWKARPHRPDQHWLDALAGCCVAASMCGVGLTDLPARPAADRPRRRLSEIQAQRGARR